VVNRNALAWRARLGPARLLSVRILFLGYLNGHGSQPRIFADIPRFRVGFGAMITRSGVLGNTSIVRRRRSRNRTRRLTNIAPLSA